MTLMMKSLCLQKNIIGYQHREVLGEGVFLALDDDRIKKWRMHKTIQQRSTEILEAFLQP